MPILIEPDYEQPEALIQRPAPGVLTRLAGTKAKMLRLTASAEPEHTGVSLPSTYERHIILSDYHHRIYKERDWVRGGFASQQAHDPTTMRVVEQFMLDYKPTHIHYLGDFVDFFAISRFCKAKPDPDEVGASLGAVRRLIRQHRLAHPSAVMAYYLGNHEFRWQNYIEINAEALSGVVDTSYNHIFDAEHVGLQMHRYKVRVPIIPGVLEITHGDKVRSRSGYTAHAMLERGVSGVSGHTHRLGAVYKTTRAGMSMWVENGCLCNTSPAYIDDPDWQQGLTVMYVDRVAGRFHMDLIPIIQAGEVRRIVYAGNQWEESKVEGTND